ncbi:MAG: M15 family metallopeptidase [Cyanobacteria bacterium J06642_2]
MPVQFTPTPKPYLSVPISECGEPLLPVGGRFACVSPAPYVALGAPYGNRSPFWLREDVVRRLAIAQAALLQKHPEWRLLLFDGFRPLAVQRFMVEYSYRQLLECRGLQADDLSPEQQQALYDEVFTFWALPSEDPATPPPHSTGGAVDLTLADANGQAIWMGSEIDEISPRSQPDYFLNSSVPDADVFHARRQLLNQAMTTAGFLRHPNEWWHFSYGDQLWAWQLNQRDLRSARRAIYGGMSSQ